MNALAIVVLMAADRVLSFTHCEFDLLNSCRKDQYCDRTGFNECKKKIEDGHKAARSCGHGVDKTEGICCTSGKVVARATIQVGAFHHGYCGYSPNGGYCKHDSDCQKGSTCKGGTEYGTCTQTAPTQAPTPGPPTVVSQQLTDVAFPTLNSLPSIPLAGIESRSYCNAAGQTFHFAEKTEQTTVTTGSTHCFHWDATLTAGATAEHSGISISSAGVPGISQATGKFEVQTSTGEENCEKETKTVSQTVVFPSAKLDPYTKEKYQFVQYQGKINSLPYTATLVATYADGSTKQWQISGTYDGVSYGEVMERVTDYAENVHSCQLGLLEMLLAIPAQVGGQGIAITTFAAFAFSLSVAEVLRRRSRLHNELSNHLLLA